MRSAAKLFAVSAVLITLCGCATLFAGKKSAVAMGSTPPEAEVYVDGNRMGVTPVTLELAKKKDYTVVFKRAGYKDATYMINTKVGAGWIVLDVLGGLVPVVIDAATGSWKSLDSRAVNVTLAADGAAAAAGGTASPGVVSPGGK